MTKFDTRPHTQLEIHYDRIAANISGYKESIPPTCLMMGVLKCNAYGLGAVPLARFLIENGVHQLAVASPTEALDLRGNGIDVPLLLFGETLTENLDAMIQNNVMLTVFSDTYLRHIARRSDDLDIDVAIHLKVDTGMNRVGCSAQDLFHLIRLAKEFPRIKLAGIYSHYAFSESATPDRNYDQFTQFSTVIDTLRLEGVDFGLAHLANTNGFKKNTDSHFDMIRIGLGFYANSFSLRSVLGHVKTVPAGQSVSYEGTYTTTAECVIGTVLAGYGRWNSSGTFIGWRGFN